MGECGLVGGLGTDGAGHLGEGGLDIGCFGPNGDIFDGVAIGDASLGEAVDGGGRSEGVDSGDVAVAVAEAWGVTCSGGGHGVTADVDGGFLGDGEEGGFDEGIELLGLGGIGGLEREAGGLGEEALVAGEEAGVEGLYEVGWSGRGLAGVAA